MSDNVPSKTKAKKDPNIKFQVKQDQGHQAAIAIAVVAMILLVFIIVMVVIIIVILVDAIAAWNASVGNTSYCNTDPTACNPPVITALSLPTTFPDDFNNDLAKFGAQLMINFYDDIKKNIDNVNMILPSGLTLVSIVKTADPKAPSFGYTAYDSVNQTMYVVLRGTHTSAEWKANAQFSQVPFYTNICSTFSPLVHKGFLSMFGQVRVQILNALNTETCTNIVFYGHSLGSAVGTMCSLYFQQEFPDANILGYFFGPPRVGNVDFANCVNQFFQTKIWRIFNENDIVAAVPPSVTLNLKTPNSPWIYQNGGSSKSFAYNWEGLSLNHSVTAALRYLNTLP